MTASLSRSLFSDPVFLPIVAAVRCLSLPQRHCVLKYLYYRP